MTRFRQTRPEDALLKMLNDIAKRFLSRTADHPAEEDADSMPVEERK